MAHSNLASRSSVIKQIEQVIEALLDDLGKEEPMCIALRGITRSAPTSASHSKYSRACYQICFPGGTRDEARRFSKPLAVNSLSFSFLRSLPSHYSSDLGIDS